MVLPAIIIASVIAKRRASGETPTNPIIGGGGENPIDYITKKLRNALLGGIGLWFLYIGIILTALIILVKILRPIAGDLLKAVV